MQLNANNAGLLYSYILRLLLSLSLILILLPLP